MNVMVEPMLMSKKMKHCCADRQNDVPSIRSDNNCAKRPHASPTAMCMTATRSPDKLLQNFAHTQQNCAS